MTLQRELAAEAGRHLGARSGRYRILVRHRSIGETPPSIRHSMVQGGAVAKTFRKPAIKPRLRRRQERPSDKVSFARMLLRIGSESSTLGSRCRIVRSNARRPKCPERPASGR